MKLSTAVLIFVTLLGTVAFNPTKASAADIDIRANNQPNRFALADQRLVEQRAREQQQHLAEQRAREQQRLTQQRAREQQQRLAQQRAQQQRLTQQRAQQQRFAQNHW